jgi:hypothetical protein
MTQGLVPFLLQRKGHWKDQDTQDSKGSQVRPVFHFVFLPIFRSLLLTIIATCDDKNIEAPSASKSELIIIFFPCRYWRI